MAQLFDSGVFSVLDTDSSIGVGWKLNFYASGTSTRLDTYPTLADATASTNANANPVVLGADGRVPPIWYKAAAKVILTDENDVVKETLDPIQIFSSLSTAHIFKSLADFQQEGETDQEAFEAAVAWILDQTRTPPTAPFGPGGAVYIPDGDYTLTDALDVTDAGAGSRVAFWAVPGTVNINVASGQYAFDVNDYVDMVYLSGITFKGGKGAYRQKSTSTDVSQKRRVEQCLFIDYTECAIASNASDDPFWDIEGNIFMGATGSDTRGVAVGGLPNRLRIVNNVFQRNQYHIVLGPLTGGGFHIEDNAFLSYTANHCDADIVLVASTAAVFGTNAGIQGHIDGNEFGPENLNASAPRILLSSFNTASGTGRENYPISTTWRDGEDGTHWLRAIKFSDNRFGLDGTYAAPIIKSYINRAVRFLWNADNVIDGGTATYLVQWMGARSQDYVSDWDVRLDRYSLGEGAVLPFDNGISNYSIGPVHSTIVQPPQWMSLPGSPPVGNEVQLAFCDANGDWGTNGGSTKGATTGPDGLNNATLVTAAAANVASITKGFDSTDAEGRNCWIVLSLARSASDSVSQVRIQIINFSNSAIAGQWEVTLPTDYERFEYDFIMPSHASPANWLVTLIPLDRTAGTGDEFRVGDMNLAASVSPMAAPPATLIADPAGGATVDAEARTAINSLIDAVQRAGIVLKA